MISRTKQLTTCLCCAAALCLVDQLLARLAAVEVWFGWALNRQTLGAHGILVTCTVVAVSYPCLANLVKREGTS